MGRQPVSGRELLAELLADPYGRWFVLVALIVGAVVVALLLYVTRRRRINAALDAALGELRVIRHEVKNDHTVNMRVEQDERHGDNTKALARIENKVDEALVQLGVHEYRITELAADVENTRDRRPS
jgi:hypothetical protein